MRNSQYYPRTRICGQQAHSDKEINVIEQTIHMMREMRLSAMATEYRRQSELSATLDLDFDERLALLCQAETDKRADSKLKRLIKTATLSDSSASLEDIRYSKARNVNKELVSRLSNLGWIRSPSNIIITGACGTGKSWIASAWGMRACHFGHSVKMVRLSRLGTEFNLVRGEIGYLKMMDRIARVDVLIIDDFGLDRLDATMCRDLLEIAGARYNRRPMILTAQLPVARWHDLFEDKTIADAFLDRVVHNAYRFELKGPSLREAVAQGGKGDQ